MTSTQLKRSVPCCAFDRERRETKSNDVFLERLLSPLASVGSIAQEEEHAAICKHDRTELDQLGASFSNSNVTTQRQLSSVVAFRLLNPIVDRALHELSQTQK